MGVNSRLEARRPGDGPTGPMRAPAPPTGRVPGTRWDMRSGDEPKFFPQRGPWRAGQDVTPVVGRSAGPGGCARLWGGAFPGMCSPWTPGGSWQGQAGRPVPNGRVRLGDAAVSLAPLTPPASRGRDRGGPGLPHIPLPAPAPPSTAWGRPGSVGAASKGKPTCSSEGGVRVGGP